jgi:gamma-glutamyltranspeptidase/glutathione hydrolase
MAEAFQQVYADRATHLGDPDFEEVPVNGLLSEDYLQSKIKDFHTNQARTAVEVRAGTFPGTEKEDTTHFSIMDQEGNAVVSTQTVNGYFGSRVFVKKSGFVLNNGMDDFSQKAGALNLFGAVGGKKNLPEPGKRPLSSMSPTIVLENGKPVLALGCPNGTRIISGVAQVILNRIFFGMDLYDSVRSPRIHHQWQPDELWLEEGNLAQATSAPLAKMGYRIKPFQAQNFIQAVSLVSGHLTAVSDPRDVAGAIAE